MPLHLSWQQIVLRLVLTVLAGACIGVNREEQGRPAGLRTTILVCLAASVSMIQANLLLATTGKASDSFVIMDLLRLPLGILSGMGFIGAGAILRREESVRGVTTAATLWFTTVMGLCFGGGQLGLGIATLALGFGTLAGLKRLEGWVKQDRHANLIVVTEQNKFSDPEVRAILDTQGFRIHSCSVTSFIQDGRQEMSYEIHWRAHENESAIPLLYETLIRRPGVIQVGWKP